MVVYTKGTFCKHKRQCTFNKSSISVPKNSCASCTKVKVCVQYVYLFLRYGCLNVLECTIHVVYTFVHMHLVYGVLSNFEPVNHVLLMW